MYRPVLVTPPAVLPVTVAEAQTRLRVQPGTDDDLISALIGSAVSYLDGWAGILGRALVEQTWRQDFDCFDRILRLPLGPALSVEAVEYRDSMDQSATVDGAEYALQADALGPYVRFRDSFVLPSDLYETAAVSITYSAGYANTNGTPPQSTVPDAIKTAIVLMVSKLYSFSREDLFKRSEDVEGVGSTQWAGAVEVSSAVDRVVDSLIAPYRVRSL